MDKFTVAPVMGIPVVFKPKYPAVAQACRFWPFKRIIVGPAFQRLPMDERIAVLYHEAGHCLAWHMEMRILLVPLLLFSPRRVREWVNALARAQELEADDFARSKGYGAAMARFIRRFKDEGASDFYPLRSERIARLEAVK